MRRLRMLGVGIAAALGLVAAGSAHAAPAPWVGPLNLSQPATGAAVGCGFVTCPGIGAGDVALTPAGDLVAAWTRRDAAGAYHVEASTRPAGGAFSAPKDLGLASLESDPTDAADSRPSPVEVKVDAAGAPVIVWLGPVGGKRVVQASFNLAPPANVSSPGQDASDVKLAVSPSGEAAAAWVRSNGTNTIAQAAVR